VYSDDSFESHLLGNGLYCMQLNVCMQYMYACMHAIRHACIRHACIRHACKTRTHETHDYIEHRRDSSKHRASCVCVCVCIHQSPPLCNARMHATHTHTYTHKHNIQLNPIVVLQYTCITNAIVVGVGRLEAVINHHSIVRAFKTNRHLCNHVY